MRTWRKEPIQNKSGTSWRLVAGRAGDRVRIPLGLVSEATAEQAVVAMNEEEQAVFGTPRYDRMIRLSREEDGPEKVLRALLPDPAIAALFGPPKADYERMSLEAYVKNVWGPVRKEENQETWGKEEWLWGRHLFPHLGTFQLRELDKVLFDTFINTQVLKQDGAPCSWNTKRLVRAAYAGALTYAERKGHIKEVHKFYEIKGSQVKALGEAQPLTDKEVAQLIEAAPSVMHATLFAFSVESGARPSEIRRADWADVSWAPTPKAPHGTLKIRGTKTAKAKRTIPLLPLLSNRLRDFWMSLGQPKAGIIFSPFGDGQPYAPRGWKTALRLAAERAGISGKRIFPYLSRHTAATSAKDSGASDEEVAAFLGHTNPRMVRQVYDHGDVADRLDLTRMPNRKTG